MDRRDDAQILLALLNPSATSIMLEMPSSASPRSTMGTIAVSPAVGCTRMFMPAFSFSTLATAEEVV